MNCPLRHAFDPEAEEATILLASVCSATSLSLLVKEVRFDFEGVLKRIEEDCMVCNLELSNAAVGISRPDSHDIS